MGRGTLSRRQSMSVDTESHTHRASEAKAAETCPHGPVLTAADAERPLLCAGHRGACVPCEAGVGDAVGKTGEPRRGSARGGG